MTLKNRAAAILIATTCLASCDSTDRIRQLEDLRRADSAQLIQALRDGSSEQRARAALAMGRIQSTSYVEPLAAAVQDQSTPIFDLKIEADLVAA